MFIDILCLFFSVIQLKHRPDRKILVLRQLQLRLFFLAFLPILIIFGFVFETCRQLVSS